MSCDLPDYDPTMYPYSPDKCCVYYGHAGLFDAQGDAVLATSKNGPVVKVCDDLGAGSYCINDPSSSTNSTMLTCAAAPPSNRTNDVNVTINFSGNYSQCGSAGTYAAHVPCINSTANVTAPGTTCTGKKMSEFPWYTATQPTYMKRFCDNFNKTMTAANVNGNRYFCVGANFDHILECPSNTIVQKCGLGCMSKFEADGTPCGKSACMGYHSGDESG